MIPPRFLRAVNNARPHGAHRYDLFGPKIGRRLTLFGRLALDLWVRLESDPHVVTYCERPLCIPGRKAAPGCRLLGPYAHDEKLCLVLRTAECEFGGAGRSPVPGFSVVEPGLFAAVADDSSAGARRPTCASRKPDHDASLPGEVVTPFRLRN